MLPKKKVTRYLNKTRIEYRLPDGSYHREDGPAYLCEYDDGTYVEAWWYEGRYHRYGGPAYIIEYDDGEYHEEWWYEGRYPRYGGPTIIDRVGRKKYRIHNDDVTMEVETWLTDMGYVWETMGEQEKWELELFMRTLG